MNNKILLALTVILISIVGLGMVSADNDTNETPDIAEEAIDMANLIVPTSISGNQIEFSDGFTGFCLDLTKDAVTGEDGFSVGAESDAALENQIKLVIIECYKQNRENDIGNIVASLVDGSHQSGDDVVNEVLGSGETIGNEATEKIDNTTEATFTFEHLTAANDTKSDCLAYTVTFETVESEDTENDDNATGKINETAESEDNMTDENNDTEDSITEKTNDTNASDDNAVIAPTGDDDNTSKSKAGEKENKTLEKDKKNKTGEEPIVNETNKTIINKTNTVIINEKNTTVINKTTVKHINTTTKETPKNATVQDEIMKTVGNPIFILVGIIAIVAIAAVLMRRKG